MKNLQFLLDSQTDSKIFYWMRTFALIAVVMAHATFVHPDSQVLDRLLASFLDITGIASVRSGGSENWFFHVGLALVASGKEYLSVVFVDLCDPANCILHSENE